MRGKVEKQKRLMRLQYFHVWFALCYYRRFCSWLNRGDESGWKFKAGLFLVFGVPILLGFLWMIAAPILLNRKVNDGSAIFALFSGLYWTLLFCTYNAVKIRCMMPYPIRALHEALDEAENLIPCGRFGPFSEMRRIIEKDIIQRPEDYIESAQDTCPLQVVLVEIVNVSGIFADSEHYHHQCRNSLDPQGPESVQIHDQALAILCERGFVAPQKMEDFKHGLRESMKELG
jgi:hypothetical protein